MSKQSTSADTHVHTGTEFSWQPPELPVSAGALMFNSAGQLLIVKPTYKKGWSLPGGAMEADGETPWEACQREVYEEVGLRVTRGRLVALDTRPAKPGRKLGLRLLFDCGELTSAQIRSIRLQAAELSEHRFVERDEALSLLRKPIRRRVEHAWGARHCIYLEDGRPLDHVN